MKTSPTQKGFTLIEIMVVMVILGLLVAVVGPNVIGQSEKAKIGVAKTQMKNIASALDMYKLEKNSYPSTEEGLEILVGESKGGKDSFLPSLPVDPWGSNYQYVYPGERGAFDLYSYGPDKKEGGSDDDADIHLIE